MVLTVYSQEARKSVKEYSVTAGSVFHAIAGKRLFRLVNASPRVLRDTPYIAFRMLMPVASFVKPMMISTIQGG